MNKSAKRMDRWKAGEGQCGCARRISRVILSDTVMVTGLAWVE